MHRAKVLYSLLSQSTDNSLFSIKNISQRQVLLFNIASPILYTGFPTNIAGCVANGSNDLSNRQMKTCNSLHQRMQTCELNCLKAGNIFDSRYIAVLELEHNSIGDWEAIRLLKINYFYYVTDERIFST